MTSRKTELARRQDETGLLLIDLELRDDGGIRVGWFDTGPAARSMTGGDVERDLHIAPDDVPALCHALLRARLTGDFKALNIVSELCREADVPYRETR